MTGVLITTHVHSSWSYDGSWSLEAIADAFRRRGCHAVLMAEHDRGFDAGRWADYRDACAAASTPDILLVPGMEYASPDDDVHVPVWGSGPFLGAGRPTGGLLQDARNQGRLAVIAHPRRREVWRKLEPEWLDLTHGIELWNRKYDGWAPSLQARELLRVSGRVPYAGLDFHTARQLAPLGMRLPAGTAVTEVAILGALAAGSGRAVVAGRIAARHFARGPAHAAATRADRARRRAGRVARRTGLRR